MQRLDFENSGSMRKESNMKLRVVGDGKEKYLCLPSGPRMSCYQADSLNTDDVIISYSFNVPSSKMKHNTDKVTN